ncbi:nucleoporin, WD repeat Nup82 [Schizosaccharomyces osmophilus]|uniref:Nucleoporin, WD repeat Nup82 n=1 Tax=Schizosaccharomyces osmophilus TaxID=2545709 RepID=A0AAE9W5S2_9SCHI|nr:nucleoporin, WD repeat Nup82 [Schizosaccharomyces osmophilus]WBW70574.1 nucleoporin, WD repeat Nup82 [Schizosaccharomyces osmophilus]
MLQHLSWTDFLEKHPAFKSIHVATDDWEPLPKQVCAFDTKLYVAVGNEVRLVDCEQVKQNKGGSEATSFTKLTHPELNFTIFQLVISPNGKYLAVVGKSKIVVLGLRSKAEPKSSSPSSFSFNQSSNNGSGIFGGAGSLSFRGFQGQSANSSETPIYYAGIINLNFPVICARFHPLGRSGRSLVILNETQLTLYEVENGYLNPDYTIPLSFNEKPSNAFDVDAEEHIPVSFTFNHSSRGWGAFLVYILTVSGDVYALCPVMPANAIISRTMLQQLSSEIAEHHRSYVDSENAQQLLRWLTKLVGDAALSSELNSRSGFSLEDSNEFSNFSNVFALQRPDDFTLLPALQGPFLIQPLVGDDFSDDCCDIASLGTPVIDVIVVASSSGQIDLFLSPSKISGKWSLPSHCNEPSKALVLSPIHTLRPFTTKTDYTALHYDNFSPFNFTVYHANGAHAVNVERWVRDLRLLYENKSDFKNAKEKKELLDILSSIPDSTEVVERVNTNPLNTSPDPVTGCTQIKHPSLGSAFLCLTKHRQITVIDESEYLDMPIIDKDLKNEDLAESFQISLNGDKNSRNLMYQSLLVQSPFENPYIQTSPERLIVPPELGGKLAVSSYSLRFLGTAVSRMREHLELIHQGILALHYRLGLQKEEFLRQRDHISKLEKRSTHALQKDWLLEQFAELENHAVQCEGRTDVVLQRYMNIHSPDLSDQEKTFVKEIERYRERILGERGIERKLHSIKPLLHNGSMQSKMMLSKSSVRSSSIEPIALDQLKQLLAQQNKLIQIMKAKVVSLQKKI